MSSTITKAFHLLDHFTSLKPEWGVRELAQQLGSNKSTIYRQMSTLAELKVLQQDPLSGKYRLGLKLFELGSRVELHGALVNCAHKHLEKVAKEITETVHLGILQPQGVLIVDKIESPKGLKLSSTVGHYTPVHCTALGKVLLAFSQVAILNAYLESTKIQAYTEKTLINTTMIRHQLSTIAQCGYAIDREELEDGLICVAVPVFNVQDQVVAALSASGPATRFREEAIEEYVQILRLGANYIKSEIGNYFPS
ncbi:MAG: IclR family transcriptional regulator [Cyclobacteriaceae bacterium]|nr:IclR family transcriptional regulator [Cyclobacteriaceae bacterium]